MATEPALPFDELFDADLIESVSHLRIVAHRVTRGGRPAEQRSRQLGSGVEFRDFRQYAAGDDFRAIDWNIYQRLGKLFLRLFEELEDLPLYLAPDMSESLFLEDPPRARAGLRCCLALAAVSLHQHDSVGLLPFAGDARMVLRPRAGKGSLLSFAQHLANLERGSGTDLGTALRRIRAFGLRRGLLAVVSDFFDPRGIDAVIADLGRVRHALLLVQLVRKTDREPDLRGELRLRDCETGAAEDVSVTPEVLERYRAAYDTFSDKLAQFARRRGAGLVQIDADQPVVPQLATLFESGSLVV